MKTRIVVCAALLATLPLLSALNMKTVPLIGNTFASSDGSSFFEMTSVCECLTRCKVYPECKTWAASNLSPGLVRCHTSSKPPYELEFSSNQNSVSGYMLARMGESFGVRRHGDHYYFTNKNCQRTRKGAMQFCSKIPGFRLAILAYDSQINFGMELAAELNQDMMIDLKKVDAKYQWGDGSFLNESQHHFLKNEPNDSYRVLSVTTDGITKTQRCSYTPCQSCSYILCQSTESLEAW